MSRPDNPSIYNIAAHGGFADALAQGLIDRFGNDLFGLARGLIILPNNRARRAVHDAFVRLCDDGLLLPQMVVIGDLELDESIGSALDTGDLTLDIPPSINPLDRQLMLAQMIETESQRRGSPLLSQDALRLATEFARTMDQLTVEKLAVRDLFDLEVEPELASHWQGSLNFFRAIAEQWQKKLDQLGVVDEASRRNALFDSIAASWKTNGPDNFVVAAGVTTSAPAIASFLRTIAFLPNGLVVMPDLDLIMPDEEWDMLGPFKADPETGVLKRAQETHPQYHLKLLLNRMSVSRAEVMRWPRTGDSGALAKRSRALSNAFAVPKLTARWQELESQDRSLSGVQTIEAKNSAEEAQAVALLTRQALEETGKRIAIITPDRSLAGRISAHLKRWGIKTDDTAGQPLSKTPEGVLFLNLLSTVTDGFPPAEFLALLKHPLVMAGDKRVNWLDRVRKFDLLLRGPRPAPGLDGIDALFGGDEKRTRKLREDMLLWWQETRPIFEPVAKLLDSNVTWAVLLSEIRNLADRLTEGAIWAGSAGRELADFLAKLEARPDLGPKSIKLEEMEAWFDIFLSNISDRPPYGGHPRIAIYGLLEARLQQAELVFCCGLNEGSWPQAISPDPWLAPMVRKSLGLPAQERQIGLSAHDLAGAMGARNVVLTRARRDGSGPALASRFLLRLKAMCGENLKEHPLASSWITELDRPRNHLPVARPAPLPNAKQRKVNLSVTHVDRLVADPFAFYAHRILNLRSLDLIDAEPSAAWRGTIIHDILDKWAKEDDYRPEALKERAEAFLNDRSSHPLLRTLWSPRLMQGLLWVAEKVATDRKTGREPLKSEQYGEAEIAGVKLSGIADRIDRMPDGGLAIVDYKTGGPPSNRAVKEGFNLQLGLLGAIAESGKMKQVSGQVTAFEYWSLAKKFDEFGYAASPTNPRSKDRIEADAMVDHAVAHFNDAVDRYVLGAEPMVAKLHPEYAPYADYDQLMRLEEWYGQTDALESTDG
ncbi:MAG: double-strand break repair protein AddB [Parasphingorhabdus sp.]